MANNINDRYIGLMVRLNDVKRFMGEEDMHPYDVEETVYDILDKAFQTCHTVMQGAKNTVIDCKEKFSKDDKDAE